MSLRSKVSFVFLFCIGFVLSLLFYFLARVLSLDGPSSYVIGLIVGGTVGIVFYLTLSSPTVSVAVVVDEGALLLVRQSGRDEWGLPAGHVEIGESLIEAVKRETREETGVEVQVTGLQGIYTITEGKAMLSLGLVFTAKRTVRAGLRPLESDIGEARWFSREEIKDLLDRGPLYKPDFNLRTLGDWLEGKRFPLEVLSETLKA